MISIALVGATLGKGQCFYFIVCPSPLVRHLKICITILSYDSFFHIIVVFFFFYTVL